MLPGPPENLRWPAPWRPVVEAEAATEVIAPQPFATDPASFTFEAELQHEACPGHPLHRVECRAVARSSEHPDEFVFVTAHPTMPIAFVHLTWAVENDPAFPYTVGYSSWEAFVAAWAERRVVEHVTVGQRWALLAIMTLGMAVARVLTVLVNTWWAAGLQTITTRSLIKGAITGGASGLGIGLLLYVFVVRPKLGKARHGG